MVFYPLATLIGAKIREVLVITTPQDHAAFELLLGDGSDLGMSIQYQVQNSPDGLAQAFLLGEKFIDNGNVALILGDNVFHGQGLGGQLQNLTDINGATIFAYRVSHPEEYGVVEFDSVGRVISLEEKPVEPKSNFAIPGLYFYDSQVVEIAKQVKPSSRGELEITSVNFEYLRRGQLNVQKLERGIAWLDTGTVNGLSDASAYVKVVQERQGLYIGCVHELAWRNGWLSDSQLEKIAGDMGAGQYASYLRQLVVLGSDQNRYGRD
jgi:glucose-1-phosphate thymidylyltransferase